MVTVSARSKKALLAGGLVLGILLLGLLCFYKLGVGELCDWDEARHAVSAYEMIQTGEPIVTTYEYSNDYWNLKPPLSEWLTDCTPRQGGIAAFEKDPGSYLIVVNSRLEELAQYPVVAQTEHYSLLSNS